MTTRLLNVVILAEKYPEMVNWYKQVFNMETIMEVKDGYQYTELGQGKQLMVGITRSGDMGAPPPQPRNNATIPQLQVSDIKAAMKKAGDHGGIVMFGPNQEQHGSFLYGGLADPEGNQVWVVQHQKQEQ